MLAQAIYSYIAIAICLCVCQATALPFPRLLTEINPPLPHSDKALSLLEFDVLLNDGLLSADTRGDGSQPSSKPMRKPSLIHQGNEAPSVSLFQENWQYEDYMRDWYDDEEDDTDYFSET